MLWKYNIEKQPLKFFDRDLFPLIVFGIREIAKNINCPAKEIFPLNNVTTGLNSIIQNININNNNEVACLSLTYGSTKKILKDKCERTGLL